MVQNSIENGKLVRYQYFSDGTPQLKAAIKKLATVDTITTYHPDTYEATITAIIYSTEQQNGNQTEFYQNGKIKSSGIMVGYKKYGRWIEYFNSGQLKCVSRFDKNGRRSGKQKEYYKNGNLKFKGKYRV